MGAQQFNGTISVNAVGASTIGNILVALWQHAKTLFQFLDRNRQSSGNVTRGELVGWSCIENNNAVVAHSFEQFLHADHLSFGSVAEVFANEAFQFSMPLFC